MFLIASVRKIFPASLGFPLILMLMSGFSVLASAGVPWLGVRYETVELAAQSYGNPRVLNTIRVLGIFPESGAMQAGLAKGDVLLKAGDGWMDGLKTLRTILSGARVGDRVQLEILRGEQVKKLSMTLTARPDDLQAFTGSVKGSRSAPLQDHFYQNLSAKKDHPELTILDFWATWCGPCRQTLPVLKQIYAKYSSRGLEIIGISQESAEVLQDFSLQFPFPYPLYRDVSGLQHNRYGIRSIPTLLILDRNGYILDVVQGAPTTAYLEEKIRRYTGWQ